MANKIANMLDIESLANESINEGDLKAYLQNEVQKHYGNTITVNNYLCPKYSALASIKHPWGANGESCFIFNDEYDISQLVTINDISVNTNIIRYYTLRLEESDWQDYNNVPRFQINIIKPDGNVDDKSGSYSNYRQDIIISGITPNSTIKISASCTDPGGENLTLYEEFSFTRNLINEGEDTYNYPYWDRWVSEKTVCLKVGPLAEYEDGYLAFQFVGYNHTISINYDDVSGIPNGAVHTQGDLYHYITFNDEWLSGYETLISTNIEINRLQTINNAGVLVNGEMKHRNDKCYVYNNGNPNTIIFPSYYNELGSYVYTSKIYQVKPTITSNNGAKDYLKSIGLYMGPSESAIYPTKWKYYTDGSYWVCGDDGVTHVVTPYLPSVSATNFNFYITLQYSQMIEGQRYSVSVGNYQHDFINPSTTSASNLCIQTYYEALDYSKLPTSGKLGENDIKIIPITINIYPK